MGRRNCEFDSLCHGMIAYSSTKNLLVLSREWMGCWGLLGVLLIVIVDHSLLPY
jgi:hypothetical protein